MDLRQLRYFVAVAERRPALHVYIGFQAAAAPQYGVLLNHTILADGAFRSNGGIRVDAGRGSDDG